jgi:hypothetical protein
MVGSAMMAVRRLWRPLLGIVVGLWLACFGGGTIRLLSQTVKIPQPADIGKEQKSQNTYYAKVPEISLPLPFLEFGVDGPEGGRPSNLQLFENDAKLGPRLDYCDVIIHGSMLLAAAVTVFIAR